jgi:cell division protease FtsH
MSNLTTSQRLWIFILVLIPLLGLLVFSVGSTEPAGMPTLNGRTHTGSSRFHGAPPAASTPGAQARNSTPAATETTTTELDISGLYQLLDTQPQSVSEITFVNGSNIAIAHLLHGNIDATVKIPDTGVQPLADRAWKAHVAFKAVDGPSDPWATFKTIGPIAIPAFVFLIFLLLQKRSAKASASIATQEAGGTGHLASLGKSRAKSFKKLAKDEKKLTFNDIAGADEAVKHMKRIAHWQKYRKIYEWFGAKLPRGFIIDGPPGVGKTLMVRILAHEINGNVHLTSGSDFEEMLAGVGASRVRDTWEQAAKEYEETGLTQIIAIDEIDAVAGRRNGGLNSGSESTLNAMLVEIDGVLKHKGLIIIGLTNRKDMLDPAIVRAGRLEYSITMDAPDFPGRVAIGKIHSRDKNLAPDVTHELVADMTYGFTGSLIEMVYNHAAILAAEIVAEDESFDEDHPFAPAMISLEQFAKAIDFVQFGDERTSKQAGMREKDKINTNVHELAGHALVADVLKDYVDPISKVTVMRRARALGFVSFMPDHDRVSLTKQQAYAQVIVGMAGRAAQEHFLGVEDSGASQDFSQATDLVREMIMNWGMSSLGKLSIGKRSNGQSVQIGTALADKVDAEMIRLTDECYAAALTIVAAEEPRFLKLGPILHKQETFEKKEWRKLMDENPRIFDPKTLSMFSAPTKTLEF